jgi:hypothetical protein
MSRGVSRYDGDVRIAMISLVLAAAAPFAAVHGQSAASCDRDAQFVNRFVSVDPSVLRLDVEGDTRLFRRGAAFQDVDTALVWRRGRLYFTETFALKVAGEGDTTITVNAEGVFWRKVIPDAATLARFAYLKDSLPCFTVGQMERMRLPPAPQALTYDDAIVAGMETGYVTIPWTTVNFPREVHADEQTEEPPEALPLLYEASIAPPFYIRFGDVPWSIAIVPKIIVRQFLGGSDPVPPPSFMPRATLYYWGGPLARLRGNRARHFPYLWFTASHHSNGQEGEPIDSVTGGHNYRNGNFNTNYVELGLSFTTSHPAFGIQSTQVSYQHNPPNWSEDYQRFMGYHRFKASIDGVVPGDGLSGGGFGRVRLDVMYIGGPMTPYFRDSWRRRMAYSGTASFSPSWLRDWSVFANWYDGQDYYNIRFDRRLSHVLRLGANFSPLHFQFEVPRVP